MVRAANERSSTFYAGCALWAICSVLLTAWGFGVVAVCGSTLLAIWCFGLRDKFSNEETASAYSVFNEDGKAIAGSFTSGHLERQMRGGLSNAANGGGDELLRGSVARAEMVSNSTNAKFSEEERLRRRRAAAAAAEKRFASTGETN